MGITVNRIDRAKQFLPFDALKGLREELEKREKECAKCEKKEISDSDAQILNEKLSKIDGCDAKIKYYKNGEYVEVCGKVKLNVCYKYLVVNDDKIFFADILDINDF